MSFIYDDQTLIYNLLKSALDHSKKFDKRAQSAYQTNLQNYRALRNVLDELEKQSAPKTPVEASEEISYEDDPANPNKPAPSLTSTNLEGLGALVSWLAYNKITIGGKRVAYDIKEDPKSPDYPLYKLEGNAGLVEVGDRSTVRQGYFVNKDLLKKFIVSRQAALTKKPNKVEQVQLKLLINDANKLLGTQIDQNYKEPEVVLPDNTELDRVPQVIDPKQWGQGNVPLLVANVKSSDTFKVWVKEKNIRFKNEEGQEITSDDVQNFDWCAVVNVVYNRAVAKGRGSQTPQAKGYINYMKVIADQMQCQVTQPGQTQQQGQQGQAGQISPAALQQLASLKPFNSNNINFREIQLFTSKYAPLSNRSDIMGMARQIDTSIQSALSLMNQRSNIFMLEQVTNTSDLVPYKSQVKQPVPFADVLYTIVNSAGMIYQDFVNTAKNILGENESLPLKQQMDVWTTNMDDINQLRSDLAEDVRKGPK